jgi:hypothetical protein
MRPLAIPDSPIDELSTSADRWLLLVHQIPPKPDYLRIKIGRRLQRVGAIAAKNSVYVLPASRQALEDFQRIRREILDGGGEAFIARGSFLDGMNDAGIRQLFQAARSADFEEIAATARTLATVGASAARSLTPNPAHVLARLRRRFDVLVTIDYFEAPARRAAATALEATAAGLAAVAKPSLAGSLGSGAYRGRTWVTREGIFVDRIASAWLIARFIDPDARFKFVEPRDYKPRSGELRFDMFGGEFTHVGDRCTFETLLERFALEDPVLHSIAEVVHAIDLRDGKFAREDAPGVERVLAGIARAHPDDTARLERGRQLFDELYASFDGERATPFAS